MAQKKILIVGGGGREMALALRLAQDPSAKEVILAPGSDALSKNFRCFPIDTSDQEGLVKLAQEQGVDLVVIGPEGPLAEGLTDRFTEAGIACFAPSLAASHIESSKAYAKELMTEASVPTARYQVCKSKAQVRELVHSWGLPLVLKEDGLAAGKGVRICHWAEEVDRALAATEVSKERPVVVEEFLTGFEFSLIVLARGETFIPLPIAQDYKAAYNGQQGPNTGGMGAVSPVDLVTPELYDQAIEQVIKPILKALVRDKAAFTGFLYAGLMATDEGVRVIEFNARMGDPEAEIILPRVQGDLTAVIAQLLELEPDAEAAQPDLGLSIKPGYALGVVLSSPGYPGKILCYPPLPQEFLEAAEEQGLKVIHMGSKFGENEGDYQAKGGRVVMVIAEGDDFDSCHDRVYKFLDQYQFLIPYFHFRRDIGQASLVED